MAAAFPSELGDLLTLLDYSEENMSFHEGNDIVFLQKLRNMFFH